MIDQATHTLARSGAQEQLFNDFRLVAEATAADGQAKYPRRPVIQWLARFVVGQGAGPNRDSAIFELCHLVYMVNLTGGGADARNMFFLGLEKTTAANFRQYFFDGSDGFGTLDIVDTGVSLEIDGYRFEVRYSRMPFLAALYEFLIAMDEFRYYASIDEALSRLGAGPDPAAEIRAATQAISSMMREYRIARIPRERMNGKFDRIVGFLKERRQGDGVDVDDDVILEFWLLNAGLKGFRSFRAVFDAFVRFLECHDEAERVEAIEGAAAIGTDRASGEIEPEEGAVDDWHEQSWTSPFRVLESESANQIKCFKRASEQAPLENLMEYGPHAVALPISMLRYETFGQVQVEISNDLRVKRGADSVARRIACEDVRPYQEWLALLEDLASHVRSLQRASLFALYRGHEVEQAGNGVVSLAAASDEQDLSSLALSAEMPAIDEAAFSQLLSEARATFRKMTRKGFDEAALDGADPSRIEGFRAVTGALIAISSQLEPFVGALHRIDKGETDLAVRFDRDRDTFSGQFRRMYEEPA